MKIEQRREYERIVKENELKQERARKEAELERMQDIKSMEEYSRILDKQEAERVAYFKSIEERTANILGRMEETVVKENREKERELERIMLNYQLNKEKADIAEDDRRLNKVKEDKLRMRHYLQNQMQEKKVRDGAEKSTDKQLVKQWLSKEEQNWEDEKRRIYQVNW